MTETEFYQQLDEMLLNNTGNVFELMEEYGNEHNHGEYDRYHIIYTLVNYLEEKNYRPSAERMDELWQIASFYESTRLVDTLLVLQDGKCSFDTLIYLLETEFAKGFEYVFNLINEYPNSYRYEPDDYLYGLLKTIIQDFHSLIQGGEILRYFLKLWTSSPILQKDLNQLIYDVLTFISNVQAASILMEFGADPFANYYKGDVDTGIPIVFKVMQNNPRDIETLLECTVEAENWNILDEWGRNLLHYAISNQEVYEALLQKGVDPDHRAVIEDESKVVVAKMKGTLPKEYGKTPRELVKF